MKFKSVFVGALLLTFSLSQVMNAQSQKKAEPWPVPANEKSKANPVKADDATLQLGKTSWSKNCASCHGKTGLGDGVKGRMCKTHPGRLLFSRISSLYRWRDILQNQDRT